MKKNQSSSPIGIFDSGLGGLSILQEIRQRLPYEPLIYYADSLNAPYGQKSASSIIEISKKNTKFLLSKGCKIIVVACNTATTNAINILRETYNVPFIGIEPAIKPAALNSKNGNVGVLATKGTLSSRLFYNTSKIFATDIKIVEVVGKGIVEAIESDAVESSEFQSLLREQLLPFKNAKIDTLVLGCSHYPFITSYIQQILGYHVNIIDSGFAVAKQAERVLDNEGLNIPKTVSVSKRISIYRNGTSIRALNTILKKLKIENFKLIDVIKKR